MVAVQVPHSCLLSPPAVTQISFSLAQRESSTLLPKQAKDGCLPIFQVPQSLWESLPDTGGRWGGEEGVSLLHGGGKATVSASLLTPSPSPVEVLIQLFKVGGIRVEPQLISCGRVWYLAHLFPLFFTICVT